MLALLVALAVSAAAGCGTPVELPAWPVDQWVLHDAQRYAASAGHEAADRFVERARQAELERVLARDLIVVGTVSSIEGSEWRGEGDVFTSVVIEIDECLKGDWDEGRIVAHSRGGSAGGHIIEFDLSGPDYAGPWNNDPPRVGGEYIFLLQRSADGPTPVAGGRSRGYYEIVDGVVQRKQLPLDAFVEILRQYLESRDPMRLFMASDVVVQGEVLEVVFHHKAPEEARSSSDPRNHVLLRIQRVGKGDLASGRVLRVELPYTAEAGQDTPRFSKGEQIVLFLCRADAETWELSGGWDSKLPVSGDGTFAGYRSLSELARAAQDW